MTMSRHGNRPSMNVLRVSVLKRDIPAGIVTFLVALPLCLGIALASTGRTDLLFSGIISGVVGGIFVGFLSKSTVGVSGPAAGLVVIVLTAMDRLGSFEALLLAIVLAGFIQLVAGFLKAGAVTTFFPSAVIKGMLAGIGIIVILKEIPQALGYNAEIIDNEAFLQAQGESIFSEIRKAMTALEYGALIISLVSFGLLFVIENRIAKGNKRLKILPAALLIALIGVAINGCLKAFMPELALSGIHLVQLPVAKSLSEIRSFFIFPDFSAFSNPQVYVIAFTLAVVASLETLLCVEATDKLDPRGFKTPTNHELKVQGLGNMVSGLLGGLPITQVIVRSSANLEAGGQTKVSTITHGFLLLATALGIPGLLNKIPLASLAVILIVAGYKLSKIKLFQEMYRRGKDQFIPFMATIIAIVFFDLLTGIGIGMAVAFSFMLITNQTQNPSKETEITQKGNLWVVKLGNKVTFLNKVRLLKKLESLPNGSKLLIDGSQTHFMDIDVMDAIENFRHYTAPERDIIVTMEGLGQAEANHHQAFTR